MSDQTLYETCLDAASHLPGVWRVTHDRRYANYCTLRRDEDGLELLVHRDGQRLTIGLPVTVAVTARRHYYPYRGPFLRLSSHRRGPDIGRAIQRRLLDAATAWWRTAQGWKRAVEANAATVTLLADPMGSLPGAQRDAEGWAGDGWRLHIDACGAIGVSFERVAAAAAVDLVKSYLAMAVDAAPPITPEVTPCSDPLTTP
jgi:hypothetical protein